MYEYAIVLGIAAVCVFMGVIAREYILHDEREREHQARVERMIRLGIRHQLGLHPDDDHSRE